MANFNVHLTASAVLGGVGAMVLHSADLAQAGDVPILFSMAVVGGLLPDLDADNSVPLKIMFNVLAVGLAWLVTISRMAQLSLAELLILWIVVWAAVRYPLFTWFTRRTVHRGIFHSLLAACFAACLTTSLAFHLGQAPLPLAWWCGIFCGAGAVLHLLLDEIYSVDLINSHLKRSFGTAFKPFVLNDPKTAMILMLAITGIAITLPDPQGFARTIEPARAARQVAEKLLPQDGLWFKDLLKSNGIVEPE